MNEKELTFPLDQNFIKEMIPHRDPFLFVDEIVDFIDNERIEAVRHVTGEEDFFRGHFPERPIMPGVLIFEALAQVGVLFARLCTGGLPDGRLMVFSGCESVRFRRAVVPGDTLRLIMGESKSKMGHWIMKGKVYVGDELTAQAVMRASEFPE